MDSSNRLGPSSFDGPHASREAGAQKQAQEPAKVSDEEALKWASLLVHTLAPARETHALGLQPAPQAQTAGQKHLEQAARLGSGSSAQSDSAVTQSQLADTGSVNESVPNRLILNVDSETLGRVQLIVDRDEGGVRVLVGSDPGARSRLSEGKHAITEALSAAGVRVGALRFVALSEVGTVLAQDLMSKKSRPESAKKDDIKEQAKGSTTKRRNLNLVG